ncbi:MAG: hypothetical protein AAF328_07000 [Planctomycetota bacterium]
MPGRVIATPVDPTGRSPILIDPPPTATSALPIYSDDRPLAATLDVSPPTNIGQGQRADWSLDVSARFTNPFDPRQVRIDLTVTLPNGQTLDVPGYFAVPFTRALIDGEETLTASGAPRWHVRFRPWLPGVHAWRLAVTNVGQTIEVGAGTFDVSTRAWPGRVRVSPANPRAFAFDDGRPFVPIGLNLAWPGKQGTFSYDRWFEQLAEHGGNFARLWIAPDFNRLALDRARLGLGQLDMASAWKLDHIVQRAEDHELHLMICLQAHGGLSRAINPAWQDNPYNAARGGPCEKPTDFWTNTEAHTHFRHKLRYVVARYGHSPAVFAWEFFNEVDHTHEDHLYIGSIRDWHERMGTHLRTLDPYSRPITTSTCQVGRFALLDQLPQIDFVQTHVYEMPDVARAVHRLAVERARSIDKPHLFGEVGIAHRIDEVSRDVAGMHFHNMLWSALMTPSPGTGMSWWWDSYIEPRELWDGFVGVSRFMEGVPVHAGPVRVVEVSPVAVIDRADSEPLRRLWIEGDGRSWEPDRSNHAQLVTIRPDGVVQGAKHLSQLLHGTGENIVFHNPVTFEVDYPVEGTMTVWVTGVSGWGGGGLQITLNEQVVLHEAFTDPDGLEDKTPLNRYDGNYVVPVPAGRHTLRVENPGFDWVRVAYEFVGPVSTVAPWINSYAVTLDDAGIGEPAVLAWFVHRDATWRRAVEGSAIEPLPAARVVLNGLLDGIYTSQWWDTRTGESTVGTIGVVKQGRLELEVPPIAHDVALRLIRQSLYVPAATPERPIASASASATEDRTGSILPVSPAFNHNEIPHAHDAP